jgi:hypothetical protein
LLVGADYLTDKYTEEGSNANIGGKTVWCFIYAAMGATKVLGVSWCIKVDYMVV